jgi:hypothetical protein
LKVVSPSRARCMGSFRQTKFQTLFQACDFQNSAKAFTGKV